MIRKKQDVLLELLKDIDGICARRGLSYVLTGLEADHVMDEGRLPDEFDRISVAMTWGDCDRFVQAVQEERREDRFIETAATSANPRSNLIRYGAENTTLIDIRNFGSREHYGIFVRILPIEQSRAGRVKGKILKGQRTALRVGATEIDAYRGKLKAAATGIKLATKVIGRNRLGRVLYKTSKDWKFIDTWQDIPVGSRVSVGRSTLIEDAKWEIEKIDCGGFVVPVCRDLYERKVERDHAHTTYKVNEIVNTEVSYKEIMDNRGVMDLIEKAYRERNEYVSIFREAKRAARPTKKAWSTYLMSRAAIEVREIFDEEKIARVAKTIEDGDYAAFNEEAGEYLVPMRRYERRGIPFAGIPEMEELVDKAVEVFKGKTVRSAK